MKARVVDRAPCELEPGELCRVPREPRGRVVGYHVCCPACSFVTLAVNGDEGLAITEGDGANSLSFSQPAECLYCEAQVRVDHGEMSLVEDGDVHSLPAPR